MSISFLFWVLMLVVLVFGAITGKNSPKTGWMGHSMSAVVWLLFALLGYKMFGWPING